VAEPSITAYQAVTQEQRRATWRVRHQIYCLGDGGQPLLGCDRPADDPHGDDNLDSAFQFGARYRGEVIATGRLSIASDPWQLPTGQALWRRPTDLRIEPECTYSEPGRLGVISRYRETPIGKVVRYRLSGLIMERSLALGFDHFLVKLMPRLLWSFYWFPWTLVGPETFLPEEGGPLEGDVWPATLNLHELVLVARRTKMDFYRLLFPEGAVEEWYDPSRARPWPELVELGRRNEHLLAAHGWVRPRTL